MKLAVNHRRMVTLQRLVAITCCAWLAAGVSQGTGAKFSRQFNGYGSKTAWQQAEAMIDRGADEADKGNFETARKYFVAAVKLRPNDPIGCYDMGRVLIAQKHYNDAEPWLRRSIKAEPTFENWCELGSALYHQGKQKEARSCFDTAKQYITNARELADWKSYERLSMGPQK